MFVARRFHSHSLLMLLLCYAAVPALMRGAEQNRNANPQAELRRLLRLYEGEFDNYQQAVSERTQPHAQVHLSIQKINAPALGAQVFFVRAQRAGQPSIQRLDSFRLNSAQQIETVSYAFNSDEQAMAAERDPGSLAAVKPAQLRLLPDCTTIWQRTGDRFSGACTAANSAVTMLAQAELLLPELPGDELGGRFRRCVFYDGEVTYISETGKRQPPFAITIHNQGQSVPLAGSNFALQMTEAKDKDGQSAVKVGLWENGKELVSALAKASQPRFRFITEVVEVRLTRQKRP